MPEVHFKALPWESVPSVARFTGNGSFGIMWFPFLCSYVLMSHFLLVKRQCGFT